MSDKPYVGSVPFLWCLLFGVFYFAYKGVWGHFWLGLFLGAVTFGISWLIYPFFAKGILRNHPTYRNG